jgi:DNA-binding LytR/AlgR family response regulator
MRTLKKHVLIVEDVPVIYHEVANVVKEAGFTVDLFTPSVQDAIERIARKKPDLVLLDIQLKGETDGTFLGHLLKTKYYIPFIYVTDFDDDFTFHKSSQTDPEAFISKNTLQLIEEDVIVKTKPSFDEKHLLQQIILTLKRHEKSSPHIVKKGIIAYTDYIEKTKEKGTLEVVQVIVPYKEIAYFTTNSTQQVENRDSPSLRPRFKKVKTNYARVHTWEDYSYYILGNLATVSKVLPKYFVRISSDYIVNLSTDFFDGRINGKRLKIRREVFTISEHYKPDVEKKIYELYQKI